MKNYVEMSVKERVELLFDNEELEILSMDPSGHFAAKCGCRGWITPVKESGKPSTWGFILSKTCSTIEGIKPGKLHDVGVDYDDNPSDGIYWSFVYSHKDLDTSNW